MLRRALAPSERWPDGAVQSGGGTAGPGARGLIRSAREKRPEARSSPPQRRRMGRVGGAPAWERTQQGFESPMSAEHAGKPNTEAPGRTGRRGGIGFQQRRSLTALVAQDRRDNTESWPQTWPAGGIGF